MSWDATLAELAAHRDRARAMGGPDRLAAHRGSGKLDARGRIDALLDPGSFREIGTLVGAEVAADGIVTGSGFERRPDLLDALPGPRPAPLFPRWSAIAPWLRVRGARVRAGARSAACSCRAATIRSPRRGHWRRSVFCVAPASTWLRAPTTCRTRSTRSAAPTAWRPRRWRSWPAMSRSLRARQGDNSSAGGNTDFRFHGDP